jgi:hypothetical protein
MAILAERLGVTGLAADLKFAKPNELAMGSAEVRPFMIGRDQRDKVPVTCLAGVRRLPIVVAGKA